MRKVKTVVMCIVIFVMGYTLSLEMNPTMSEADLIAFGVSIIMEERENTRETIREGTRIENAKTYIKEGHAEGLYLGDGVILCSGEEYACIHEVAHRMDESLGNVSESPEFRTALDDFIKECERTGDSGTIDYYCNLQRFTGINGNALGEKGWGGYGEAYAEMYKYEVHGNFLLPQIFEEFFP